MLFKQFCMICRPEIRWLHLDYERNLVKIGPHRLVILVQSRLTYCLSVLLFQIPQHHPVQLMSRQTMHCCIMSLYCTTVHGLFLFPSNEKLTSHVLAYVFAGSDENFVRWGPTALFCSSASSHCYQCGGIPSLIPLILYPLSVRSGPYRAQDWQNRCPWLRTLGKFYRQEYNIGSLCVELFLYLHNLLSADILESNPGPIYRPHRREQHMCHFLYVTVPNDSM